MITRGIRKAVFDVFHMAAQVVAYLGIQPFTDLAEAATLTLAKVC